MNYNNIFLAHHNTSQTALLHGSSGFGKTATVRAYCATVNAKLIDKRMSTVDPLTLFLPWLTEDKSTIKTALVDWVQAMITCTEHTVIFLDEITNPSSPEVFNVLKELLGERTILGRPISKHVQFIGASNLSEEDTGVKELPDSLWKRATHLKFIPSTSEVLDHLEGHAQTFFSRNSTLLHKPTNPDFPLHAVPRQINACVALANTELLSEAELRICFQGKIGLAGIALATFITENRKQDTVFPTVFTRKASGQVSKYEQEGRALEVITYLKQDQHNKEDVAWYLATTAIPETVRAYHEAKLPPLPPVSEPLFNLPQGMAWQIYASKRSALSLGGKAS